MRVVIKEELAAVMTHLKGEKPAAMQRQKDVLEVRYDLCDKPAVGNRGGQCASFCGNGPP